MPFHQNTNHGTNEWMKDEKEGNFLFPRFRFKGSCTFPLQNEHFHLLLSQEE